MDADKRGFFQKINFGMCEALPNVYLVICIQHSDKPEVSS
jgi:hypothetical protein